MVGFLERATPYSAGLVDLAGLSGPGFAFLSSGNDWSIVPQFAKADLPSSVAYRDEANTFTQNVTFNRPIQIAATVGGPGSVASSVGIGADSQTGVASMQFGSGINGLWINGPVGRLAQIGVNGSNVFVGNVGLGASGSINGGAADTQWQRVSVNSSRFVGADGTTLGAIAANSVSTVKVFPSTSPVADLSYISGDGNQNIHFRISGLDMMSLRGYAGVSVAGGNYIGFTNGSAYGTADTRWQRVSPNVSQFVGADGTTLGSIQAGNGSRLGSWYVDWYGIRNSNTGSGIGMSASAGELNLFNSYGDPVLQTLSVAQGSTSNRTRFPISVDWVDGSGNVTATINRNGAITGGVGSTLTIRQGIIDIGQQDSVLQRAEVRNNGGGLNIVSGAAGNTWQFFHNEFMPGFGTLNLGSRQYSRTFNEIVGMTYFVGGHTGPRLDVSSSTVRVRSNDGTADGPLQASTLTARTLQNAGTATGVGIYGNPHVFMGGNTGGLLVGSGGIVVCNDSSASANGIVTASRLILTQNITTFAESAIELPGVKGMYGGGAGDNNLYFKTGNSLRFTISHPNLYTFNGWNGVAGVSASMSVSNNNELTFPNVVTGAITASGAATFLTLNLTSAIAQQINLFGGSYTLGVGTGIWLARSGGAFQMQSIIDNPTAGFVFRVGSNSTPNMLTVENNGNLSAGAITASYVGIGAASASLTESLTVRRSTPGYVAGFQGVNTEGIYIYQNPAGGISGAATNALVLSATFASGGAYRPLVLATNDTARLTIGTDGNATFSGSITATGNAQIGSDRLFFWGGNGFSAGVRGVAIDTTCGENNISGTTGVAAVAAGNGTALRQMRASSLSIGADISVAKVASINTDGSATFGGEIRLPDAALIRCNSTFGNISLGNLTATGLQIWNTQTLVNSGVLLIGSDTRFNRLSTKTLATQVFESSLSAWQETERSQASPAGALWSVFGATPIGRQTLPAAATDAATTQTLANAIRQLLIDFGFSN